LEGAGGDENIMKKIVCKIKEAQIKMFADMKRKK